MQADWTAPQALGDEVGAPLLLGAALQPQAVRAALLRKAPAWQSIIGTNSGTHTLFD